MEQAIERLHALGVDTSDLFQDYYKIPLENIDLQKVEKKINNKKSTSVHTLIVDSRQRDYTIYPTPSDYSITLMESHRNVERIELIAAMIPKTEYNVNSENNLLLLTMNGVQKELYLTPGQYFIGTNSVGKNYIANGDPLVGGLLLEVQEKLNTHPDASGGFNVFLATTPPPNGTGPNASVLNRVVITCVYPFSINFTNTNFSSGSPFRLLGFEKGIYSSAIGNSIYGSSDTGVCTSTLSVHNISIQSIIAFYDYDMYDDPNYIIMQMDYGNKSADRIESIDIATNQKFAVVIYDANEPDTLQTYNAGVTNVQYQFTRQPGRLKALKGTDFDKKILNFTPSITLENLKFQFLKYDSTFYNFHNREHLLTFEITVVDFDPQFKN
jgi:hypothetical protein